MYELKRMIKWLFITLFRVKYFPRTSIFRVVVALFLMAINLALRRIEGYTPSYFLLGKKSIIAEYYDGKQKLKFIIRPRSSDWYGLLITESKELSWFYENIDGSIFIDVGAHVGGYTVRACRKAKLIIAIEPYIKSIEALKNNLELNNCNANNIIIINKAIGDSKGLIKMLVIVGKESATVISKDGNITVKMDTLDNIINELGIDKVDLLKIDIEGAEALAIYGMRKTLEITRNIIIEVRPETMWVINEIIKHGYEIKDYVDYRYYRNYYLTHKNIN